MILVLAGCELPVDASDSYTECSGGTLRVGRLKEDKPAQQWIEKFARQVEAEIDYYEGTPEQLHRALKEQQLHMVYGELESDSPFLQGVAISKPYHQSFTLVAHKEREPEENEWREAGLKLSESTDRLLARILTGKEPVPNSPFLLLTADQKQVPGMKATVVGETNRYVLALPPGENRLLVEVDKLLWSAVDESK